MPKTIFDLCVPRKDVQEGRVRDEEFAADLSKVATNTATPEYGDPKLFFKHTHPTRGLKKLLSTVCRRLSGTGGELDSVLRLDTQFGGGKTHGLIALVHAVRGMQGVTNIEEFVDPAFLPKGNVRIAALDGENCDPANGLKLEDGLFARSLWGEMAYRLAGREGFERVKKSDETHVSPGTDTIVELFGGEPALILIDEVAVYLRKVAKVFPDCTDQFAAFIQALLKAVSATPQVSLVFTLAVRSDDKKATDAYREEQQIAMSAFEEAESVAGRKSTQLNPTEEDETASVLRRRLFEKIDDNAANDVVEAFRGVWKRNADTLSTEAEQAETWQQFQAGYPLHPETLAVLTEKTSSLANFQRTRGMLRLLARTVHDLWQKQPTDALAIHPHHIDLGVEAIRDEITTRLGQGMYTPALKADVAAVPGASPATAQEIDTKEYPGQPPVTSYLARTIFMHTLAFGDTAKGIADDRLRFSVCSPTIEPAFVESARKLFVELSLHLDDRPGAVLRFMVEPNLTQVIQKTARDIDNAEIRAELQERIRDLFSGQGQPFEPVFFPAGPYEIPDEIRDGRPYLAVLHYDAATVSAEPTGLPSDIVAMATRKGTDNQFRVYQNNVVFTVADKDRVKTIKKQVRRRLGLKRLQEPERIRDLADYQQEQVKEEYRKSDTIVSVAIAQCYRHLFYPSNNPLGGSEAKLDHTVIDLPGAAEHPGKCQRHIRRSLRDQKKVLDVGDAPDAPAFVRDQTPLKIKGEITAIDLRNEYRRSPNLSILLSDDPLLKCIREGIEQEVYIYRVGEQVWGKGDPTPTIQLNDNAFVHTIANAKEHELWPRKVKKAGPGGGTGGEGGDTDGGGGGGGGTSGGDGPGGDDGNGDTATASPTSVSAQGPLKLALTELFEKARTAEIKRFKSVRIRLYEAKATWDVHQAVATYNKALATCGLKVEIEADGIEEFNLVFRGSMQKANNVKSFLTPQIQTATDVDFDGSYQLAFNSPLPTDNGEADSFVKAMTKYGSGEAYVEAEAAGEDEADG